MVMYRDDGVWTPAEVLPSVMSTASTASKYLSPETCSVLRDVYILSYHNLL